MKTNPSDALNACIHCANWQRPCTGATMRICRRHVRWTTTTHLFLPPRPPPPRDWTSCVWTPPPPNPKIARRRMLLPTLLFHGYNIIIYNYLPTSFQINNFSWTGECFFVRITRILFNNSALTTFLLDCMPHAGTSRYFTLHHLLPIFLKYSIFRIYLRNIWKSMMPVSILLSFQAAVMSHIPW